MVFFPGYFLLPPSVISSLSSVIFFPRLPLSFPPLSFAKSPAFPTSTFPGYRGRANRRVRWSENTPKVPGGGFLTQRRSRRKPSLNLKNRGKWGPCHPVTAPMYQRGRDIIAVEDLSTFGPHFLDLAVKKESVAESRDFARTPDPRVPQSPELHVSPICHIPGSPGIPPPAVLTSVIFSGFLQISRPNSFGKVQIEKTSFFECL